MGARDSQLRQSAEILELRAHLRRSREQQDLQVTVTAAVSAGAAADAITAVNPSPSTEAAAGVTFACAALEGLEAPSLPSCAPETPPRGLVAQAVCAFERRCQSSTPTGGSASALRWGPRDGRVPTPQSVGAIGRGTRSPLHMVAPPPTEAPPLGSC